MPARLPKAPSKPPTRLPSLHIPQKYLFVPATAHEPGIVSRDGYVKDRVAVRFVGVDEARWWREVLVFDSVGGRVGFGGARGYGGGGGGGEWNPAVGIREVDAAVGGPG